MGVIKDGIKHICKRLDDLRDIERNKMDWLQKIAIGCSRSHSDLMTLSNILNDLSEKLEKKKAFDECWKMDMRNCLAQMAEKDAKQTITVAPVETSKGETLFLVTGDELCNLLEACKGATVRMKKEAKKRDAE